MNRVEPLDQSIGTNSTELPAFEAEDREDVDHDDGEMSRDGHKSLESSEMDVRQSTAEMRSEVTIRGDDPIPSIKSHHSETVRDNLTDGTHDGDGHTDYSHPQILIDYLIHCKSTNQCTRPTPHPLAGTDGETDYFHSHITLGLLLEYSETSPILKLLPD